MGIIAIIFGIALVIGLAVLFLKVVDRMTLGRSSSEAQAEAARRFQERLANPSFEDVERHYGCALPGPLRALFSDAKLVAATDLVVAASDGGRTDSWHFAWFYPADVESLKHTFFDSRKHLPIADDGFGNCYIIDPRVKDPAVRFHDHETGELSNVADRLSVLVARMKWHASPNK